MSFLERAIRRGVSNAVGKAVENAVEKAVEPAATNLANKAADKAANAMDNAAGRVNHTPNASSGLEGAVNRWQQSVENYATEAAKNLKICPSCGEGARADQKFCPKCGTKLPEMTVAQGTVCPACGKQNTVGTKFCSDCGAKLPATLQEEQEKEARDRAMMREWEEKLPHYPKWDCGGGNFNIEVLDDINLMFSADFGGEVNAAYVAVKKYRECLLQNGFRQAGQYPSAEHLYKKVDGVCYHVDTEHCFDGDGDCPTVYFNTQEPTGGYDYVKPEPKKSSFFDLFK